MNKNVLNMNNNNGPHTILSSQPFNQSITVNGIYTPKIMYMHISNSIKKGEKSK